MPKSFFEKNKMLIIVGIVVLVILLMVVGMYNSFVTLDQNIKGKWSLVENDYQRQADLIPNLISTISSQVGVETKFVKDVIALRTVYASAQGQYQKDSAGQQMNGGITVLVNAVAENYPQLLASEGYTALRDELAGSQNRITVARKNYIDALQAYNTAIKRFPGVLFAGMFGFSELEYYEAPAGTETPQLGSGQLP
ncbi:MAG: LemA family protein [Nanoarchaeota archaeon]|nr:LemA family protein [Nanoarchaeota archaeon]MBU4124575.1 LemA family protein [Nanoarchaeota archaeon]